MKLTETYSDIINNGKYDEFIKNVNKSFGENKYKIGGGFKNLDLLLPDLINYIESSGVKSISFEHLNGASGMAHYDKMILNNIILYNNFCSFLYVVLHETSHYYQFKKHGTDIEWELFNKDDVDNAVEDLLKIEIAADKLALRKFRDLKVKYNIPCNEPKQFYTSIKKNDNHYNQIKGYIMTIKKKMETNKISNNTELVDLIYNTVK